MDALLYTDFFKFVIFFGFVDIVVGVSSHCLLFFAEKTSNQI